MDNRDYYKSIRSEIERRRDILIKISHDRDSQIDPYERKRIQADIENWGTPCRPSSILSLTKQFCCSAFSYSILRRYLSFIIKGLLVRDTVQFALAKVFNNDSFLNDSNWKPVSLKSLALKIQEKEKFNLTKREPKPRIISVLITGSDKLSDELSNGLETFYNRIENVTKSNEMWDLAKSFSIPIRYVGVSLICDFFKEIGFTRYVKIDHHFRKEFPGLVKDLTKCDQNPKMSFILSQRIADEIGITPYHLDAILYLWGRYGKSI